MSSTHCPRQILAELGFSGQICEKHSNFKFLENASSGSRVVPCGRTDVVKLIVTFRNFANGLKKGSGAFNTTFGLTVMFLLDKTIQFTGRDNGSTVVKVLCHKSEGRWFDPSCQKILPIALWPWGRISF